MSEEHRTEQEQVPLMQRLYDSPILLLIAGLVVIFVFYTAWGLLEVLSIPKGTLP